MIVINFNLLFRELIDNIAVVASHKGPRLEASQSVSKVGILAHIHDSPRKIAAKFVLHMH